MTPESRVSRREVLQRAAVIGGSLVWLAPAIQTLTPRAYADVSPGVSTCCQCQKVGAAGTGPQYVCFANNATANTQGTCTTKCSGLLIAGSSYAIQDFHQDFPAGGPTFSCIAASPSGTTCSPVPH